MKNDLLTQELDLMQVKMGEWRTQARSLPAESRTLLEEVLHRFSQLLAEMAAAYDDLERVHNDQLQAQLLTDLENQRYKELFEQAPLGYLILDRAGKIRTCNATASRVLQIPEEVLVGQALMVMVAEEDQRRLRAFLRQRPAPPRLAPVELHLKRGHPAGEGVLLWMSRPMADAHQPAGSETWVSILEISTGQL